MSFLSRLRPAPRSALLAALLLAAPAVAIAQTADKPAPARKPPPPGLIGNTVPQCESGTYPAGGNCRPSPPDHYVPSGSTYPIPCPKGAKAPAGSRSATACVDPAKKDDKKK